MGKGKKSQAASATASAADQAASSSQGSQPMEVSPGPRHTASAAALRADMRATGSDAQEIEDKVLDIMNDPNRYKGLSGPAGELARSLLGAAAPAPLPAPAPAPAAPAPAAPAPAPAAEASKPDAPDLEEFPRLPDQRDNWQRRQIWLPKGTKAHDRGPWKQRDPRTTDILDTPLDVMAPYYATKACASKGVWMNVERSRQGRLTVMGEAIGIAPPPSVKVRSHLPVSIALRRVLSYPPLLPIGRRRL